MVAVAVPALVVGVSRWSQIPSVESLIETEYAHIAEVDPRSARIAANTLRNKMMERPKIPEAVRQLIFMRDGYRCVACHATENLTLDHIIPWSLCGPDTVENLQTLCGPCNSKKGVN